MFGGVTSAMALGEKTVLLGWSAAQDLTPPSRIVYRVYLATSPGGESFSSASVASVTGIETATIEGLSAGTTYYFVVRAVDEAGNEDTNTVERSALTPDTKPPVFGGADAATPKTPSSITVSWTAATDNVTAAAQITYLVYQATSAGGQSFATPQVTTAPGATSVTIKGLAPAQSYYYVVRARDGLGNVDTNLVERSATTPAASVSFAGQIQPIFTASCALPGCHTGTTPQQGLDLSAGAAHASIVGVASSECATTMRVEAGASTNSYLMWKVVGSGGACFTGAQMPKTGAPLTTAQRALIATWIDEGALDN